MENVEGQGEQGAHHVLRRDPWGRGLTQHQQIPVLASLCYLAEPQHVWWPRVAKRGLSWHSNWQEMSRITSIL